MSFTPEPPAPPSLNTAGGDDTTSVADADYRREELATLLDDGAWEDAFTAWAADSSLSATQWQVIRDLDLIDQFDFFWDDVADRVGYHAPGLPENWREQNLHPELDSWGAVSGINAELTELGQLVCDVLKDDYIDWESEFEAPDDLPDF